MKTFKRIAALPALLLAVAVVYITIQRPLHFTPFDPGL
jgi:hypothetical protein